ncbi:hypothetical protein BRADI_2g54226v3, partial [Brachypodium distachyon]
PSASQQQKPQGAHDRGARARRGAMEYGYPCSSCNNKEKTQKRPPLKRGQLKLQIARTLSSLIVPGAKISFRR